MKLGGLVKVGLIGLGGWLLYDRFIRSDEVSSSSRTGRRMTLGIRVGDDMSAAEAKSSLAALAARAGIPRVTFEGLTVSYAVPDTTDIRGVINLGSIDETTYQRFLAELTAAGVRPIPS